MSMANPSVSCYGAWLTTTLCRNWDEVMEVVCHDWGESTYAQRKNEEAILRRKDAHKQREDLATTYADDDLFCIRVNKDSMEAK